MTRVLVKITVGIFIFFLSITAFADSGGEFYINKEYGFSIATPAGWMRQETNQYDALVGFVKTGTDKTLLIGVTIDNVSRETEVKEARDFSNIIANQYEQNPQFVILSDPEKSTLNNIQGSQFTFTTKDSKAKTQFNQLLVGENIITVFIIYEDPSQLDQAKAVLDNFRLVDARYSLDRLQALKKVKTDFQPIEDEDYFTLRDQIIRQINAAKSFKTHYVIQNPSDEKLKPFDYKSIEWTMIFASPYDLEFETTAYPQKKTTIWRVSGPKMYTRDNKWVEAADLSDPELELEIKQTLQEKKDVYKILTIKKYKALLEKEKPVGVFEDNDNDYIVLDFEPKDTSFLALDRLSKTAEKARVVFWVDDKDKTIRLVRLVFKGKDAEGRPIKEKHEQYFQMFNNSFVLGVPQALSK